MMILITLILVILSIDTLVLVCSIIKATRAFMTSWIAMSLFLNLLVVGITLVVMAFFQESSQTGFVFGLFGITFLCLAVVHFIEGTLVIEALPAHMGLVTVWGRPTGAYKTSGITLIANFFPFSFNVLPIEVERVNIDFAPFNVPCRLTAVAPSLAGTVPAESGGVVSMRISISYRPDPERFPMFVESGLHAGATKDLDDVVPTALRQIGEERTWEQLQFGKGPLTGELVELLTDAFVLGLPKAEQSNFFVQMAKHGERDRRGLGIRILTVNIVEIMPLGELADAARQKAVEVQERRAEIYEEETILEQAELRLGALRRSGDTTTKLNELIKRVRDERVQDTRRLVVEGLENASGATTIGAGLLGGNLSNQTGGGNK
jgi:regulator of protease activity HflC (stomatin/prohibitin superfamily)